MYVSDWGGGGKRDFERKNRDRDYAISNQHWVCKFEEMGYVSKNKKIIGKSLCSAA